MQVSIQNFPKGKSLRSQRPTTLPAKNSCEREANQGRLPSLAVFNYF